MQMRAGGAPGLPDPADHLTLRHLFIAADQNVLLMQIDGRNTLPVIDQGDMAAEIFRLYQRNGTVGRSMNGRTFRGRDIHPHMRRHRRAVQDAAAAEHAADRSRNRPLKDGLKTGARRIAFAGFCNRCGLGTDARQNIRRRCDISLRQADDALRLVDPRNGGDGTPLAAPIAQTRDKPQRRGAVIGNAKGECAIRRKA